jgi:alpha-N-acetylglucosaminidase
MAAQNTSHNSTAVEAVQQLLHRLLPPLAASQIELGLLSLPTANASRGIVDAFELLPPRDPTTAAVLLRGTSGVAMAAGLWHYLFNYCNSSFGWLGDNLAPSITGPRPHLPRITTAVQKRTAMRFRFGLNYCVWAYSVPYWDWARWEREIDQMALWGVNLINMIVAMPWTYQRVFQDLGLTTAQIPLPGPSFSDGIGSAGSFEGPLPQRWIEEHRELQHQILERMKQLGMSAVLPAFSGAVPQAFPGLPKYNTTKINIIPGYGDFTSTMAYIDPSEPLFHTIGEKFVRLNREEFGDHGHFYDVSYEHKQYAAAIALVHDSHVMSGFDRSLANGFRAVRGSTRE